MSVEVPLWLLWSLGGLGVVILFALAVIGLFFLWTFRNFGIF